MSTPIIFVVAGSDCSGGAGIQADIKTISILKGYAASVITIAAAQNMVGVQAVYPIPPDIVRIQTGSVMDDLQPATVKTRMMHNAAIVRAITEYLQGFCPHPIVCDPAMMPTGGRQLVTRNTIHTIQEELFPLCSLITPNLSGASLLPARTITDVEDMKQAAHELADHYHCTVLVKNGHLFGTTVYDVLYGENGFSLLEQQKIESCSLHGTGCMLSSVIVTPATCNNGLEDAVRQAKTYMGKATLHGEDPHIGHGNGPLCRFPPEEE